MRVLFVGAGAIGGYFGGRLLEAGRDVTFLVRPRRAAQLAEHGLTIKSPCGDFAVERPRTILAEKLAAPYDLVILCCKAYDLEGAIDSFAPAMGPASAVLPLLNGMRHMDLLEQKFGGMLHALSLGAPPHGGIAPGIDRIVMLLCGEDNLREVVLFPMNQRAEDLMMGAPSEATPKQLRELNIRIVPPGPQ